MEHILAQEEGKKRYLDVVSALSKAFALAVPHDEAIRIRDEVAFYDALEVNDSAVKVLGDDCLLMIAQELVATVRRSVTIDYPITKTQLRQCRRP